MLAISSSMLQLRNGGCSQTSFQPQKAESGSSWCAPGAGAGRCQVGLARLGDAGHRQVFDQDVRRQHHRRRPVPAGSAPRTAARSTRRRCGRTARAAAWCRCPAPQQRRQHLVRLAVHEVGPQAHRPRAAWSGRSRGASTPGRGSPARRTDAPGSRATSTASPGLRAGTPSAALVARVATQAYSMRSVALPAASRCRRTRVRGHWLHAGCSFSRSLKRWILPVAVLGRSATNSIWRGYL
jgi:hypothetical protein